MVEAAVLLLAGTESQADVVRVENGLETAREFGEIEHDELELIFEGAGTQWVPELEDPDHDYHETYCEVRDEAAVCRHCAESFGVADTVESAAEVEFDDADGHPSYRTLVTRGFEVITF